MDKPLTWDVDSSAPIRGAGHCLETSQVAGGAAGVSVVWGVTLGKWGGVSCTCTHTHAGK
jgi:hypothetical protein